MSVFTYCDVTFLCTDLVLVRIRENPSNPTRAGRHGIQPWDDVYKFRPVGGGVQADEQTNRLSSYRDLSKWNLPQDGRLRNIRLYASER